MAKTNDLISIITNDAIIEKTSTVIAKLEHLSFVACQSGHSLGSIPPSVFRTEWGKELFGVCSVSLFGDEPFDLDDWFRHTMGPVKGRTNTRRDIDPSLYMQTINTNWLAALLELEMKALKHNNCSVETAGHNASFLMVLHNILELEDKAQAKLAACAQAEKRYDFLGVNKTTIRNATTKLLTDNSAGTKTELSDIEELLARTKPKTTQ